MSVVLPGRPPLVWPEARVVESLASYEFVPPFGQLALEARSLFGTVTAITSKGVRVLEGWLASNLSLKVSLVVMVYPTCATRQEDLLSLLSLVSRNSGRLAVCLHPLELVTERATNALCFLAVDSDEVYMVTGPTEDLGQILQDQQGHLNVAFRADPALVEAFKRSFDWLWAKSPELAEENVSRIPHLVLPAGTEEGALLWRAFVDQCNGMDDADVQRLVVEVDPETGEVKITDQDGNEVTPPTEDLGLPKLDQLSEKIVRLYEKGALVCIDKLSRIPPLDAPLDPNLFGDPAELQSGNVSRKVSMRVSVIDEKTLKEIDRRRQGLRPLLNKFSYALADNMRWMPAGSRGLFEAEVKRISDEGQQLIAKLLDGDLDAFLSARRPKLEADINAMYRQLGRSGQVPQELIDKVVETLKARLGKAQGSILMPKLSYSSVRFSRTENELASPWGQACALLLDIATFPRKALTDGFFFRGLKVSEDDLIDVMNVADDAICRDRRARGIKDRCKVELHLLSRIEAASLDARARCELVVRILTGDTVDSINRTIEEKSPHESE